MKEIKDRENRDMNDKDIHRPLHPAQEDGFYDKADEAEYERRLAEHHRRIEERRKKRRRQVYMYRGIALVLLLLVIGLAAFGVKAAVKYCRNLLPQRIEETAATASDAQSAGAGGTESGAAQQASENSSLPAEEQKLFAQADRLAAMYDYDGAAVLLNTSAYGTAPETVSKINSYVAAKAAAKAYDLNQVTHIFFHALIIDPSRALTANTIGQSFNSAMCTKTEFERVLDQMYKNGFVLVGLHDLGTAQTAADGSVQMTKKQIMLPPGKKAFVLSEDDVCFYEYMTGHGFATRMVLDADGKPAYEYTDANGKTSVGDYDIVPILDKFVEAHPDFSYHGAKATLAFTGYNGILGYRTDETYDPNSPNADPKNTPNPNIEQDRNTVKQLTKVLKEDGYTFASHSWGHINFTTSDIDRITKDTDRWERNVEPLLPDPCDIFIFPFGADIADWHAYTPDNAKFALLEQAGFRYFCNVDSSQYWLQYGGNFLRMGRRDIDGYRLYEAYSGGTNRLSDLFDVQSVFDTVRPTPIGWNYN